MKRSYFSVNDDDDDDDDEDDDGGRGGDDDDGDNDIMGMFDLYYWFIYIYISIRIY